MRFRQVARHVLTIFGSGVCAVAFALLTMLSLISMPVQACSCLEVGDWGFIGPQDGRLPANSVGVAWFSTHGGRTHPALEERFTVEIWDGSVFRPLSVTVNPVGGYTGLYVVAPEGERMRPGPDIDSRRWANWTSILREISRCLSQSTVRNWWWTRRSRWRLDL